MTLFQESTRATAMDGVLLHPHVIVRCRTGFDLRSLSQRALNDIT
jgi:hypothetical protein